jgi:predicted deacylase
VEDDSLAQEFRQEYVISAVPVVNPDGVDEGHYRHNAYGVDLNRDWVEFKQQETTLVRDYFLRQTQHGSEGVHFALDFHSTWSDLFYSLLQSMTTDPPNLLDRWLEAIDDHFSGETLDIRPSGLSTPTSKTFFYSTFGCPSVIYEVGDNTDRDYVREKARYAATALMELLLEL